MRTGIQLLLLTITLTSVVKAESAVVGFFPGTSSIAAKSKSNITVAILLPYKSFWNLTTQSEYDACAPFCPWFRQMDSGADLAVQQVNNNPNILPETMVNIIRVAMPKNGPGGVAPVALEIAQNLENVVAVVGDVGDLSTSISGSVMSQYKIPMCGGTQNLPALSVTFSNRFGDDISEMLKKWKVKRVALVFDEDDIESTGERHYHGNRGNLDFSDILNEFKHTDARYIIVCAQAWSNSYYLVDAAKKMGMMSSKHVWITTQPAYSPDYS
ncbi:UNVERIFIED_CONTAM: hypothetical protein HDU68_008750, partial [Siphonaria sp. JEL0065]